MYFPACIRPTNLTNLKTVISFPLGLFPDVMEWNTQNNNKMCYCLLYNNKQKTLSLSFSVSWIICYYYCYCQPLTYNSIQTFYKTWVVFFILYFVSRSWKKFYCFANGTGLLDFSRFSHLFLFCLTSFTTTKWSIEKTRFNPFFVLNS